MATEDLSVSQAALKFNISSPALLSVWRTAYAQHGMIGLTSKAKGSKAMSNPYIINKPDDEKTTEELKREKEYLRAENAYLKKLDAPRWESKQPRQSKAHRRIKDAVSLSVITYRCGYSKKQFLLSSKHTEARRQLHRLKAAYDWPISPAQRQIWLSEDHLST